MSVSRKNWSALSSLARQWTMEDEEEVERERRVRVKSSSGNTERDTPTTDMPTTATPPSGSNSGAESRSEPSQNASSVDQMQLDFVEMLRVRDEKRRLRHVETLRRQKEVEEEVVQKVELPVEQEEAEVFPPAKTTSRQETAPSSRSISRENSSQSLRKDSGQGSGSSSTRKFVSSVSISLDTSSSTNGHSSPVSPCSPTALRSPRELRPHPAGAEGPVQNGQAQERNSSFEQTDRVGFIRQSSRTLSFRMMKKKEEETSPLQRSASVRGTTRKFETTSAENEDEEKTPSFIRNSRQRISSRSIQEKMERLAQAAQRSESNRSVDVTQRTLFLLDEVSRKRGMFERTESQEVAVGVPGTKTQETGSVTSGMSERISRRVNRSGVSGSGFSSSELRNVSISNKRSLFENRDAEDTTKSVQK